MSSLPATALGTEVIKYILSSTDIDPSIIDEIIIGHALAAGTGANPARKTAVKSGDAQVVVAGGQESMSNCPHILKDLRKGKYLGDCTLYDHILDDGLLDVFSGDHMGVTAENIAEKYQITRKDQDEYAIMSINRALAAKDAKEFDDEIIPITVKQKKEEIIIKEDEQPRRDSTFEKLSKLKPAFKKLGTVTAGNSSTMNDGAAMLMLMSEKKAEELKLKP